MIQTISGSLKLITGSVAFVLLSGSIQAMNPSSSAAVTPSSASVSASSSIVATSMSAGSSSSASGSSLGMQVSQDAKSATKEFGCWCLINVETGCKYLITKDEVNKLIKCNKVVMLNGSEFLDWIKLGQQTGVIDEKQATLPSISKEEEERLSEEWVDANTKPCPRCGIRIVLNSSCNHMTCRCGHQFCWLCGQPCTGGEHFHSGSCQGRWFDHTEDRAAH